MPFIKTEDGTELFYKDWGTGQPLVFVHGWCINCDSWEYLMNELLASGFRCIAYDQRGCGRSAPAGSGYDYDTLASDLATVISTLSLEGVTLIGHSMGCGIIARYLSTHGAAPVSRAVLLATTTPFPILRADNPVGIEESYCHAALAAMRSDRPAYVRNLAEGFFSPPGEASIVSPDLTEWAIGLTLQASSRAALEMQATAFFSDQRQELTRVRVPVLLLHGEKDVSCPVPLTAGPTQQLLPNSQLKIYENQAHGLVMSGWQAVSADIQTFIAQA